MGNHRFKLSDMIPNAWFYKLKDMSSRSRKHKKNPHAVKNKKSSSPAMSQTWMQPNCLHYFPTETTTCRANNGKLFNSPIHRNVITDNFSSFTDDSPRRSSSSKRRFRRKTIYKPSPNQKTRSPDYYASMDSSSSSSELDLYDCVSSESDDQCDNSFASNCSCRVSSSTNDIIIDMNHENLGGFDAISQLGLAPILTKPVRFDDKIIEVNESRRNVARKSSTTFSRGIRLRANSPKLSSKRVQACARRRSVSSSSSASSSSSNACKVSTRNIGFPEGFAVVKSSIDPQRDFRESMVEMIMENNIRKSEDLEDLLACYLSLNSREYHELIIKAFEQIWFDMAQLRM